jgi:hypothetical protein
MRFAPATRCERADPARWQVEVATAPPHGTRVLQVWAWFRALAGTDSGSPAAAAPPASPRAFVARLRSRPREARRAPGVRAARRPVPCHATCERSPCTRCAARRAPCCPCPRAPARPCAPRAGAHPHPHLQVCAPRGGRAPAACRPGAAYRVGWMWCCGRLMQRARGATGRRTRVSPAAQKQPLQRARQRGPRAQGRAARRAAFLIARTVHSGSIAGTPGGPNVCGRPARGQAAAPGRAPHPGRPQNCAMEQTEAHNKGVDRRLRQLAALCDLLREQLGREERGGIGRHSRWGAAPGAASAPRGAAGTEVGLRAGGDRMRREGRAAAAAPPRPETDARWRARPRPRRPSRRPAPPAATLRPATPAPACPSMTWCARPPTSRSCRRRSTATSTSSGRRAGGRGVPAGVALAARAGRQAGGRRRRVTGGACRPQARHCVASSQSGGAARPPRLTAAPPPPRPAPGPAGRPGARREHRARPPRRREAQQLRRRPHVVERARQRAGRAQGLRAAAPDDPRVISTPSRLPP